MELELDNVQNTSNYKGDLEKYEIPDLTPREFDGIFVSKEVTPLEAVILLYEATRDLKDFKEVHIPWELEDFARFTYKANGFDTNLIIPDLIIIEPKYPRLITFGSLFTGGKDSFSSYVKYHHLYQKSVNIFVKGLGHYHTEYRNALRMAESIGIDLDIVSVKLPKLLNQPESPVKNLLTHLLLIERYRVVPEVISFGTCSGELCDNYQDVIIETDDRYNNSINDKGLIVTQGSVQNSLVSGDTAEAGLYANDFLTLVYGYRIYSTKGTKDELEAYKILESYGVGQESSSCMTSEQWKGGHKARLNKFGVVIENKAILSGTLKISSFKDVKELSILELEKSLEHNVIYIERDGQSINVKSLSDIKLSDMVKVDYWGEYECGVCFKCAERILIYQNHLNYHYAEGLIKLMRESLYRFLIKNQDVGNDTVVMDVYLQETMKMKLSDIPNKYKKQIKPNILKWFLKD